jgi:hypothetical protein
MSSEVQIAIIDQQDTQIVLAVPGVQGATGSPISAGGTANQVLRKASSTNYDTDWSLVTNAMVDSSAAIAGTKISPDFGSQNVVTTGTSTAASFIPTSSSVPTNGVYLPSANNVAISTNGTQRVNFGTGEVVFNETGENYDFRIEGDTEPNLVFVDASTNRVGLGTSSPGAALDVTSGIFTRIFNTTAPTLSNDTHAGEALYIRSGGSAGDNNVQAVLAFGKADGASVRTGSAIGSVQTTADVDQVGLAFYTSNSSASSQTLSERVRITHAGNVGIAPNGAGGYDVLFNPGTSSSPLIRDSSGRLLVGTSNAIGTMGSTAGNITPQQQLAGSTFATASAAIIRTAGGSAQLFMATGSPGNNEGSDNRIGGVYFNAYHTDGYYQAASIEGFTDTPAVGAGDMPGRLVFSTSANGASSPTERMRITQDGQVLLGNTAFSATANMIGFANLESGATAAQALFVNTEAADESALLIVNRHVSDGRLVQFRQANTTEGTISVSGTTVTYGGGHLARWSQLPNDEDPSNILKGTVVSNLDEMCEWGEEDNEQLNKTKVSDVEGDPNVAGVFVSTSFDEDGPLDFFVAMTGDMIIRIAEGVTVQRGDLLMSAGDGTAKPQDDDIIRSKTIAKVTSTHVTCTYDDGSYCVPCVLMAC